MTRETKIGLLVGLAFIIVIGILLSEHVTSTNEPPQAAIGQIGDNVRQAVNAPGAVLPPGQPVVLTSTPAPAQPVSTPQDLANPPAQSHVEVGGPAGDGGNIITVRNPGTSGTTSGGSLDEVARRHGEELTTVAGADALGAVFTSQTHVKEYKAEPGDTLSRMAGRFMGKNTKTNRDLIVKANPCLKGNPDRIVVGKVYVIPLPNTTPTISEAAMVRMPTTAPTAPATPTTPGRFPPSEVLATAGQPTIWYTVKSGDNLWRIAVDQVGSSKAVDTIKELNKDVLKGSDRLKVNMKLLLPARAVARAS